VRGCHRVFPFLRSRVLAVGLGTWPTMSMLAPDVHAELGQLLLALQAKDNTVRSQAEEHLQNNWTNTRPEVLLMGLAEQIAASKDSSVCPQRSMSGHHNSADTDYPWKDTFLRSRDFPPYSHEDEKDTNSREH